MTLEWSRRIGVVFTFSVVVRVGRIGILQLRAVFEGPCEIWEVESFLSSLGMSEVKHGGI